MNWVWKVAKQAWSRRGILMDFTESLKTCNEWFLCGSCKDFLITFLLVCYPLMWAVPQKRNLSPLSSFLSQELFMQMDRFPGSFFPPVQKLQRLRRKWIHQRLRWAVTSSALPACHLWTSSPSLVFSTHCLPFSKYLCAVVTRIWFWAEQLAPPCALHPANSALWSKAKEPSAGSEGTAICHFHSAEQSCEFIQQE